MRPSCRSSLVSFLALLLVACGGGSSSGRDSREGRGGGSALTRAPFPDREATSQLAARHASEDMFGGDTALVPFPWVVADVPTSPTPIPHRREGVAGDLLAASVEPFENLVANDALRCVAGALARATLESGGKAPESAYRRYALAECGAPSGGVATQWYTFSVTDGAPSSSQGETVGASFREVIGERMPGAIGVGYASEGSTGVALLAMVEPALRLDEVRPVADAQGRVQVRGEVLSPEVTWVGAAINQGALATADCQIADTVPLPRFWLTCPMGATDAEARISLRVLDGGDFLARELVSLTARKTASAEALREARFDPDVAGAHPVATPQALLSFLGDAINERRRGAGMPPMQLALAESERLRAMVPALALENDPGVLDELGKGVIAGWDVRPEDPLRDGAFSVRVLHGAPDGERWLAAAMLDPALRRTFFDRSSRVFAVGAVVAPEGIGAVAASWRVHGSRIAEEVSEEEVLRTIRRARAQRGLPGVAQIADFPELDAALASVREGRRSMQSAMRAVIQDASRRWRRSVGSFAFETTNPQSFEVPEELLQDGELIVGLGATHRRVPNSPWGTWVVGIVYTR